MEKVKKLEKRGDGGGETIKEHVLFRGDAVFVTEMNVVCLSGPVTGEERITVTVRNTSKKDIHYMIGRSVKLGFLMKDFCDRNSFSKSQYRFIARKTSKQITENETPVKLGLRDGDVILVEFGRNCSEVYVPRFQRLRFLK